MESLKALEMLRCAGDDILESWVLYWGSTIAIVEAREKPISLYSHSKCLMQVRHKRGRQRSAHSSLGLLASIWRGRGRSLSTEGSF